MSRLPERIIMGLLTLFLLITVGYQVYLSVYGSIKTETIFEYTVSRSIPVEGVAIRSELLLEGSFTGIENYIYEDGTRVSIGENIAEFYDSRQSNRDLQRSRELEAELKMLEEAQNTAVNNFSTAEILNRDIKEQLVYLSKMSETGRFASLSEARANLVSLINKKQIAIGMTTSYEERIASLRAEYDGIEKKNSGNTIMFAKTPASGYFSKEIDGHEEKISPTSIEEYGISDFLALIDGDFTPIPSDSIGKIVTDQNWLFAAAAQKSSLEFVMPGQEVFLTFDSIDKKIPATVKNVMLDKDEERSVLLLSCNQVSGELLSIRNSGAAINFNNYTGLRINMSDIRFQGETRGVYVLDGNTVYFRQLDPIYEEQSFVLSRLIPPGSPETNYVALFDQIITKGNDLYDGKVIQ